MANARDFYDVLIEAFPEIDDGMTETIEPSELRGGGSRTSLLSSSTTTIKALASAWHDLRFGHRWEKVGTRTVSQGCTAHCPGRQRPHPEHGHREHGHRQRDRRRVTDQ